MITVTGWTWEYIDEYMTFPRLESLSEYWQQHPPVHVLMAAHIGFKPSNKKMKKEEKENNLHELMSIFSQTGGKVIINGK